jgi:hypothetical protein
MTCWAAPAPNSEPERPQLDGGQTAGCASTSWTYSCAERPQQATELALDRDQPIAQAMRSAPSAFRPYVSAEEMAHFMVGAQA